MVWMRMNQLKLNPHKTEVLLVSRKADQGIGIQAVLGGVTLPLKTQLCSAAGFISEPACPGLSSGQECICTVKISVPAAPIS